MADFLDADDDAITTEKADIEDDIEVNETIEGLESVTVESTARTSRVELIDASMPLVVVYCPYCSFPPEYCEYGVQYSTKCLPWIREHCPEVLGEAKKATGGDGEV